MDELYDLDRDPFQLHNLARDAGAADVVREMRGRLHAWMKRTHDTARFDWQG
jgi:hypothetical protein